eukprot:scaffold50664_cov31-Tisochrysis_lutea.AAC.4
MAVERGIGEKQRKESTMRLRRTRERVQIAYCGNETGEDTTNAREVSEIEGGLMGGRGRGHDAERGDACERSCVQADWLKKRDMLQG